MGIFDGHSALINGTFRLALSNLPAVMRDVLIGANALQFVLSENLEACLQHPNDKDKKVGRGHPTASHAAGYFVLHHIINRTLPFKKVFEFVSHGQVLEGIPQIAIAPAPYATNYPIKFALAYLSPPHSNFLIKLKFKNIVTPMYGLNWSGFMKVAVHNWYQALIELDRERREKGKKPLVLSDTCIIGLSKAILSMEHLEQFQPAFDFLLSQIKRIDHVDNFAEHLKAKMPKRQKAGFDDELKQLRNTNNLRSEWGKHIREGVPFRGCFES